MNRIPVLKNNFNLTPIFLGVSFLLLLAIIFYVYIETAYTNRILPKVTINNINVGGMTMEQVQPIVEQFIQKQPNPPVWLSANNYSEHVSLSNLGLSFDSDLTIHQLLSLGHNRNLIDNFWIRLQSIFFPISSSVAVTVDDHQWQLATQRLNSNFNRPTKEAEIKIDAKLHIASVVPSVTGLQLNSQLFKSDIITKVGQLDFSLYHLPVMITEPQLNTVSAQAIVSTLNQKLNLPLNFTVRAKTFSLPPDQLWSWVNISTGSSGVSIQLNPEQLNKYFTNLEATVNSPMQNAVWKMENGKVIDFKPDTSSTVLKVKDAIELTQASLLKEPRTLPLPVNTIDAKVKLSDLNNLGINELVAQGVSNFSGSPANRRHNIQVGAAKFNHVLIPPKTVFSFAKTLGPVDASTGYLPELVIKGDETTPEYGGGLCQVSSTLFRAALNGGYPITERKNHSYRVVYYEPAGTDATVYPPSPDLKFQNDTSKYLLLSTYIVGDNLYFDIYGTSMPRKVELKGPYISNVTNFPEPVYIETSTLPVGETKKVDTAHKGADAILYRSIYDLNDKLIRKDEFKSHYIPWPAKYLIGAVDASKISADLKNVLPDSSAKEESLINLPTQPQPSQP